MSVPTPKPTPPHVFDAMDVISEHLKRAGYVGVYIGDTGGAVFYRDCPLKRTQHLLEQLAEYEAENRRLREERSSQFDWSED